MTSRPDIGYLIHQLKWSGHTDVSRQALLTDALAQERAAAIQECIAVVDVEYGAATTERDLYDDKSKSWEKSEAVAKSAYDLGKRLAVLPGAYKK